MIYMKKSVLLFALSCLVFITYGQQVARNMVVVEVGTGTWCQYCPGAAMGCDDLLANGYQVAIVKYHSGDSYANTYSNARVSYYGVPGFPTAYFDGQNAVVGGSNTQSMFPQYSVKVNQRMAVLSSFTIDLEGTHQCLTSFTANITVNKVAANNSTNLRLHAVLTETHIPEFWQGMNEVHHVARLMVPNQNGTTLNFSGGNTQSVSLQFALDPTWVFEECELVVFLQDQTTKEIFQATKMALTEFAPEFEYDASVKSLSNLPRASCSGEFAPEVKIRNIGSETMTSVDIVYSINNGDPQIHPWTGSLDYLGQENVTLPGISFTSGDSYQVTVFTSNPNGNNDECPSNDQASVIVPQAVHTPNTVKLMLRTDSNPTETTWDVRDSEGNVLYSGGPYTSGGQMIQQTFELADEDCYTFSIYDSGGDGLVSPGFVMLYYGTNTVFYQNGTFTDAEMVEFNTADPVGVGENAFSELVRVYPNPLKDKATLLFNLEQPASVSYKVIAVTGQKVAEAENIIYEAGQHSLIIDAGNWKPGMYLYQVRIGDRLSAGKLTVK